VIKSGEGAATLTYTPGSIGGKVIFRRPEVADYVATKESTPAR